ncbi:MAG TPA: dATP/dGTP pyrophosphohydrolase domain-containing protein [Longimicrobiaceae bacterium]|nr:dATP/dGTP pyrophosphohydrolase domain-containing protein [Longimicrobiaceae bacterium]
MAETLAPCRVYLAGPMTGYPEHNFPAFRAAREHLRALGFDVVCPAELEEAAPLPTWEACMRRDVALVAGCEAVVCLPGWERSRGATVETDLARTLGMPVACAETLVIFDPAARGCGLGRRSLDDLLADVVAWQRETFPVATPASVVEHLRREVAELVNDPHDAMEQADALFLLAGLAAHTGVDLADAVRRKLEINRARVWGAPDAHGVVEHVRGEEEPLAPLTPDGLAGVVRDAARLVVDELGMDIMGERLQEAAAELERVAVPVHG